MIDAVKRENAIWRAPDSDIPSVAIAISHRRKGEGACYMGHQHCDMPIAEIASETIQSIYKRGWKLATATSDNDITLEGGQ